MDKAQIVNLQLRDAAFRATPIGAAFTKFKNAFSRAWIMDTESGYRENVNEKRLRETWEAANAAEQELRALLDPIAFSVLTESVTQGLQRRAPWTA
jgi:hypothetical protein